MVSSWTYHRQQGREPKPEPFNIPKTVVQKIEALAVDPYGVLRDPKIRDAGGYQHPNLRNFWKITREDLTEDVKAALG